MAAALLAGAAPQARAAVVFGQLDDFQSGTTAGWDKGFRTGLPLTNVPGGAGGETDRFLRNESVGGISADSRMVVFNEQQWGGNYASAGVTRVHASFANLGAEPLSMRVTLIGGLGTAYSSAAPRVIPADGQWHDVHFDLTAAALRNANFGAQTLDQVLSSVVTLRLLHAKDGPAERGDPVAGTLGVDDVRALRLPGDADFDGRVGAADLGIVRANLNTRSGATWTAGDFNFDGRVNAFDMRLLRQHFGQSVSPAAPPAAVLPEPTAAGLLIAAATLLVRRRRSHRSSRAA